MLDDFETFPLKPVHTCKQISASAHTRTQMHDLATSNNKQGVTHQFIPQSTPAALKKGWQGERKRGGRVRGGGRSE